LIENVGRITLTYAVQHGIDVHDRTLASHRMAASG
jgi:hypothetical protein